MDIYGNHSIKAAANNKLRKHKIFFGSIQLYNKLELDCKFINYKDGDFLEVNEAFIEYDIEDFFNHNKIILLDSLMDPRNVGAIIRSAAAFGFYVILRENRGCPINSTVIQCASGGVDNTKIITLCNINNNLKKFQDRGFIISGLHETGKEFLFNYKNPKKILIVIGSEHDGISKIILDKIDVLLNIQTEEFSTLNASVAASIAMFKFYQ